jgi:hypothetical protein
VFWKFWITFVVAKTLENRDGNRMEGSWLVVIGGVGEVKQGTGGLILRETCMTLFCFFSFFFLSHRGLHVFIQSQSFY